MKKFKMRYSSYNNCECGICFRITKVVKVEFYTTDYASNNRPGKICKTPQHHPHELWICPECISDLQKEVEALKASPEKEVWDAMEDKDLRKEWAK